MSRLLPELSFGDVRATGVRYSPGGDPIYILTATNCTDESELVLNVAEAKALHEWLGRAIAAVGSNRPVPETKPAQHCGCPFGAAGEHSLNCPLRRVASVRVFTGVGELEQSGYIPAGSAAERERPDERSAQLLAKSEETGYYLGGVAGETFAVCEHRFGEWSQARWCSECGYYEVR